MEYKYTTAETAVLLGISRRAVNYHVKRKHIKHTTRGGVHLLSRKSLKFFAVDRGFKSKRQVASW